MASSPTCRSLRYVAAIVLSLSCAVIHSSAQGMCLDGDIRLVDGASVYEGRVEICFGGLWGTVCDDLWDNNDASVVCRQLGFSNIGARGLRRFPFPPFGEGVGSIYFDDVGCNGSESHLANCTHRGIGNHNCDHFEDAGVICAGPCSDGEVRLNSVNYRGLASGNFGRVEVCLNGSFTAVICDTLWDNTDATVLCRQLGHSPYGAIGVSGYTQFVFGLGSLPDILPGVNCTGSELTLQDCTNVTSMCEIPNSVIGAGVVCQANATLPSNCTDGDFRLADGLNSNEGRLEVCVNGAWGTVCGSQFTQQNAAAVCQILGFSTLATAILSSFPAGSGPVYLQDISCCGNETSLLECSYPNPIGIVTCDHTSDIAVRCGDPSRCSSGDVRVVDRSGLSLAVFSGIVEVCVNHTYGAISNVSWSYQDARVLCRQQGFSPYGAVPVREYTVRFNSTPVPNLIANINCVGSELTLGDCPMDFIEAPRFDCEAINAAVACQVNGTPPANCSDGDVRLVDGTASNEGRVEICFNSAWGTICDSSFTGRDAGVVCQQLGYSRFNATGSVQFSSGTGPIFLSSVSCSGNEDHVLNCSRNLPIGIHQCTSHSSDAGVRCAVRENCTEGEVRLVGGQTELEGRVEICIDGVWGTVCDDGWSNVDAFVVCRQLGFLSQSAQALLRAAFGPGVDPILLDDVACTGSESHLANCSHRGIGIENCNHLEDAGVACLGPCDDGAVRIISDGSARTFSGGGDIVGRVEVCVGGMFGASICSDLWDNRDASVLCSQLGYSPYGAIVISNYGQTLGGLVLPMLVSIGDCSGSESSLQNCPMATSSNETFVCSSNVNVGIICQGNATLRANCSDGDVRLVDGTAFNDGRAEICFNNAWGTICNSGFDRLDAGVICQQLGFSQLGTQFFFGSGMGPIFLSDLNCNGNEENVLNCSRFRPVGIHACSSHTRDAGVQCAGPCDDGAVRIISDGSARTFSGGGDIVGRVEICVGGMFGASICSDLWDNRDASVLCSQLGYSPYGAIVISNYGQTLGGLVLPMLVPIGDCSGSESSLQNCPMAASSNETFVCSSNVNVGIICQGNATLRANCSDGDVRLVDGTALNNGRVEICFNNAWGTICNSSFDRLDAGVICQQLGFSQFGTQFFFGSGMGPIFLSDLNCNGSEENVLNCSRFRPVGIHPCSSHTRDAGVRCAVRENCTDGDVRLIGGRSEMEGRVEICFGQTWGTVCDNGWDISDASVVCTQLGFAPLSIQAPCCAAFGQGSDPILLDGVACTGTESRLANCSHLGIGVHFCSHFEDAGVRCIVPENCMDGEVRLVRGETEAEGRVEICFNQTWGTVCDNSWDSSDASVVCRQLGFSSVGAEALQNAAFGQGFGPIFLDDVLCTGSESHLANCSHQGIGVHECNHFEDAGVRCFVPENCSDGEVRLVGGQTEMDGRVEICFGRVWGTVCDDLWDSNDASVVCRQLGFLPLGAQAECCAAFGEGNDPILLDSVDCIGSESHLANCSHLGIGVHFCSHFDDAGVRCFVLENCTDGEVRLVGGQTEMEGRVEICFDRVWGTVCDDLWDSNDASVVCRQLGFLPLGAQAPCCAAFGEGNGPILLDNIDCIGSESHLATCRHPEIGNHDCAHSEDAGAICSGPCSDGEIRTSGLAGSLITGVTGTVAQLQFCVNGVFVAVCNPFWDNTEARVLCQQLGFSPYGALAINSNSDVFGISRDVFRLSRDGSLAALPIDCTGSESSLQSCSTVTGASFQCGRSTAVGVVCQGNDTLPSNCTDGDVRLVDVVMPDGGEGVVAGRVEICFNSVWGTVCSSGFADLDSAAVICRQLGFLPEGAVAFQRNGAPASVPIFLAGQCCGFESSLAECSNRSPIGASRCTHSSVLNVQCSIADFLVEGSGTTCVEGNIQLSDTFSQLLFLPASGGRLGRVEICVNGRRAGVSGDSWDNEDASVLCRQLGFSPYGAIPIDDYGQRFPNFPLFTVIASGVNCTGSEQTIQECLTSTTALSCSRNYAGVVCQGNDTVPSSCTDGELRLVNGLAPNEGRVEICFNNVWGTVCSRGRISNGTVIVACRTLGFAPIGMETSDFGSGSGPIFVEQPVCSGFEASILDCFTFFPVGVHAGCDHSSDLGIRCLGLPGSSAILRLSALNLTTLAARFEETGTEITPELVLNQITISIIESANNLPTGNSTTRGSIVDPNCRFVNPRRIDALNFWLRIECNITEYPASNTTLEYLEIIFNSSQAVSATGFCDAETVQTFYWPETQAGQQVCLSGSTGQRTSRVCTRDRAWQEPQQGCVGGVFCDSSMTISPVNGDYRWEQTTAGGTATQPCVFGSAVGGQARRQCGVDAVWREPDFTECINRLPDINLIPTQDVQQNGREYSVDIGRRFRLTCQSVGQYAGAVSWIYQNQVVSPVSVRDLQEKASGEEREPNSLFFSGSGGPVPIQRLDFSADPTRLYSSQESESAVSLVTHPDYGVVLPVGGEYTCLAVNQFGNFTQDINVNIRELPERVSYTILRFSVAADFQQLPLTVVANYLLHLQTVFLDVLGTTDPTVAQCKSVARRPQDIRNIWSRVDCNITSIRSPMVDPIIQNLQSQNTVAPLVIGSSIITSDFGYCDYEITQTNTGSYTWNETEGSNKVLQGCALGPAIGIAVEDALAERDCNMFGEWGHPDIDDCITIVTRQFLDLQESINTEPITEENIEQITEDLSEIVMEAREEVDQTQENLAVVVNVFVRTAAAVSDRQTVVVVDEQTVNNIVGIVDDLTVWPEAVLEQNSSRIIQSFETIATNLVEQENFTNVAIIEEDVVFVAERVPVQQLLMSGASFTSSRGVNDTLNADTDERVEDGLSPGQVASAILPAAIFNQIRNLEGTDVEAIGVFFSLYEESSLFPIAGAPNDTHIGSPVVAATVAGRTFRNLPEPVIVLVRLNDITDGNITARRCVSWNFTLAGGRGNWTTEGCQTLETDDTGVVMCSCNHLTNFACLVDICTRTDGCVTPPGVQLALDIISIIGVVLSLIGLVLTVITLLASKKLRQRDATKFHIQLCIALFCMLIVFVIGIDRTSVYGGCVAVSALIHYFTLVAVMWMGAEAVLMFQKLVIVFVRITTRYIVAVSIICWLVPIVPVVVPLAIDRDFMLTFDVMTSSPRFCFIGNTGVFFGAFLGPIFAILLFNAVIFIIVVVVLLQHTMNSRGRMKEQMSIAKAIRLLISIMGVMVLFGLTWVLAALTISEASLVFQILFAVFNSLQGFFIFLFFCVFSKDARDFWRVLLSCGHYKSGSSSYPSRPKVTSSADATSRQGGIRTLPTTLGHSTLGATTAGEYRSSEMDTSISFANPVVADELPNTNSPTYEEVQKTNTEGRKRSVSIFEDRYVDLPTQTGIKEFQLHYKGPPAVTNTDVLKYRWKHEPGQSQGAQETETYELDFDENNTTEL